MITMFHCTSRENLPGILKQGLLPFKPDEVVNAQKGVYLSKSPFEWMHWATDKSKYAGALIEVDITGLELEANIGFTDDDHGIPEFIYCKRIPVERIVRVSVSTDKRPTFFDDYNFQRDNNLCGGKE